MARIQVGVIGLGRMGAVHARHLAGSVAGARLVAVADVDPKRLALAEELGVKGYVAFRDMIASPDVEAIVIAGPTDQREAMLEAAIESGKPIFCEKPLAQTLDAVSRIKAAVETRGAFLQLGFMRRFDPGYAAARKKIEEGAIGEVVGVYSMTRDPHLPPYDYIASSGGIFADLAIHDFDIVRFLTGDEVASVYAIGGVYKYDRLHQYGDVDNAFCTLKFSRGAMGMVHGSRNAVYGYDVRAEVYGTEGSLRIGYDRETPLLVLDQRGASHDYVPFFFERFQNAYRLELEAFVDAVRRGAPPPVGVDDGEKALTIAVAAQRSLESGRPVQLDPGGVLRGEAP
ncbi:MAG TPA: inositol 2-dehydrogenase [Limnochordia bacterium]|nr:inositol 2-dehydrogenase [Limnochordia bacterium]